MGHKYRGSDSMSSLIADDYKLLQVLSRFGISLGFGDKSVNEVCEASSVDVDTFLAVCNFISSGVKPSFDEFMSPSAGSMMNYLRRSHNYFLDFMLPLIRRELVTAVDCSTQNEVGFLILRFFDEYTAEVKRHMEYENTSLFRYVDALLEGHRPADVSLHDIERSCSVESHKNIDSKMSDLKNIIVRYVPRVSDAALLSHALEDLFQFEDDLTSHGQLEESLFVPIVSLLESQVDDTADDDVSGNLSTDREPLSQRERDIIVGVVKGQTNKEIADDLCISIHTVLTHRRNIARKLEIHSPAGLVIYAIVNGIVRVEDIKDQIA